MGSEPIYPEHEKAALRGTEQFDYGRMAGGFILPGTSDYATCAVCGALLVLDEDRETGWRCSREADHEKAAS